jgi:hypothetical protein
VTGILLQYGTALGLGASAAAQLAASDDGVRAAEIASPPALGIRDVRQALRDAVHAYGLHLRAERVTPEQLVPAMWALIGGRRAADVRPTSARLEAEIVGWGIEGYYDDT